MNEIDAVSPEFCENIRDISDLLAEFGPYNGRYVANYPVDWRKRLMEHLPVLSTLEQKKAKELLNRYNPNGIEAILVEKNLEFNEQVSWCENVQKLQQKRTFDDVVAGVFDEGNLFKKWPEKIFDFRANRLRSMHLAGNAGEYIKLVAPLLKKGPAAYFIDPYFRPDEDASIDFVKRLFQQISNSNSCDKIVFYIRRGEALKKSRNRNDNERYSFSDYEVRLRQIYQDTQAIPKNKSLTFFLVDELNINALNQNELRLHNRFFLTKFGAIDFGLGFTPLGFPTPQIPVYLVDKDQHLTLVNWFISENAIFRLKERILISNSN